MKTAIKIYFNHVGGGDIINAVLDNKSHGITNFIDV